MDSQQTTNNMNVPASSLGETTVKPNPPLPPQGFQARPQGPPPSPRNPINNGPIGAPPRPGQPPHILHRVDSRSSIGSVPGQFVQLRPYGPPRPPGSSFPPRPPQPGQLPPQNPQYPPNQRFPYSPGVFRGVPPQPGGQRPPFANYQPQQQYQRNNDPRFQRPIPNNPSQNELSQNAEIVSHRLHGQESVFPRQLSRNDSSLIVQRQQSVTNEELKQPTQPRIIVGKMEDVNRESSANAHNSRNLQQNKSDIRKSNDNDDDDDVVMDNERSSRNSTDSEGLMMNGSKSSLISEKQEDIKKITSRPGTATIESKTKMAESEQDMHSRPASNDKITRESTDISAPVSARSAIGAFNDDKEKEKLERTSSSKKITEVAGINETSSITSDSKDDKTSRPSSTISMPETIENIKTPNSYTHENVEHRLITPSIDNSRSSIPSRSDMYEHAKQELRTPIRIPDKSQSSTPAGLERSRNAESESTAVSKTPEKSSSNTPAELHRQDSSSSSPNTPKLHSSTPIEITSNDGFVEPEKSLSQDKLSVPRSAITQPKSPEGRVRGFDNGQERSLSPQVSSSDTVRSPNSHDAGSAKQMYDETKRTSFSEDAPVEKKVIDVTSEEIPQPTSTSPSKSTYRRVQAPTKLEYAKAEQKSSKRKGFANGRTSETPTTNGSPTKSPTKSSRSVPRTPETPTSTSGDKKKLPMNKIQVGAAPSPNLKTVRSKIGSLGNTSYKPGGGKVKIENRKLDFSKAQPKIAAKNEKYAPSGGEKKISQVKLQWNAKSKIGSLDNTTYKPGGGDKKIETVKLDFKDKAKSRVGSKDNEKHVPGGGSVKFATSSKTPQEAKTDIATQKVEIKAESKIGSLDNMKHKPGGGDKKIFNDKEYLRQTVSNVESLNNSGSQIQTSIDNERQLSRDSRESRINDVDIPQPQPPPSTPIRTRIVTSSSSVVTPGAIRSGLAKSPVIATSKTVTFMQETEDLNFANEYIPNTPSADMTNGKKKSRDRSPRSWTSTRPSSNLDVKSINKSSCGTLRKIYPTTPRNTSPNTPTEMSSEELRLPKLASSPIPQGTNPITENHSEITLPKLIK